MASVVKTSMRALAGNKAESSVLKSFASFRFSSFINSTEMSYAVASVTGALSRRYWKEELLVVVLN